MLANLIISAGFNTFGNKKKELLAASEFNKKGYFENKLISLLNDQIIRIKFGEECSNLYMPYKNYTCRKKKTFSIFKYDLEKKWIYFPPDFMRRKKHYTGKNWDVWGLSRMLPDKKWHKIFSKNKIHTELGVKNKIKQIEKKLNNLKGNFVLKDPRFAFTLPFFKLRKTNVKIILLRRKKRSVLKSMRNHYGKNLFKKVYLDKQHKIVSNHFNYKIKYQSFKEYCRVYDEALINASKNYTTLSLDYENILNGTRINALNNYIGASVDTKLIDSNK